MPTYCHLWAAGPIASNECRALLSRAAVVRVLLSQFLFGNGGRAGFLEWLLYLMMYWGEDMLF